MCGLNCVRKCLYMVIKQCEDVEHEQVGKTHCVAAVQMGI